MKKTWLMVVLCIFFGGYAFAAISLTSDTQFGNTLFEESLGASGDFRDLKNGKEGKSDDSDPYRTNWNVIYDYIQTQTTDASTGVTQNLIDITNEITLELSYEKLKVFEIGGGLIYAATPAEYLREFGPEIWAKYSLDLKERSTKKSDDDDEQYTPHISLKAELTPLTFSQAFDTTTVGPRLRRPRPVASTNAIRQTAALFELGVDLLEVLSAKLSYTAYMYDRDVNSFLLYLDSPRGLALGGGMFTGTVGGFPGAQSDVSFSWYPWSAWEFDGEVTGTQAVLDYSNWTWGYKGGLLWEVLKDFRAGGAFEYVTSPGIIDHIYTASLKYDFP